MPTTSTSEPARRSHRLLRSVAMGLLCVAVMAGYAVAVPTQKEPGQKAEPKGKSETEPKKGDEPTPKAEPKTKTQPKKSTRPSTKVGSKGKAEGGPSDAPSLPVDNPRTVGPKSRGGASPKRASKAVTPVGVGVEGADNARTQTTSGKDRRAAQSKASRRVGGQVAFPPNPNAKWACDNASVTLDPVWKGARTDRLTFNFEIRNEGTEDLRIRAKGG